MAIPPSTPTRLIRWGLVVFAVGLVAIVVTFVAYAAGVHNRPVWQNLACMLAPLGFGLALWGLIRSGRADGRAAVARIDQRPDR